MNLPPFSDWHFSPGPVEGLTLDFFLGDGYLAKSEFATDMALRIFVLFQVGIMLSMSLEPSF